jgi:hypothetical protein
MSLSGCEKGGDRGFLSSAAKKAPLRVSDLTERSRYPAQAEHWMVQPKTFNKP